jgi:uncharacterized membrane-anchored protein YitT (DUF2179 family)
MFNRAPQRALMDIKNQLDDLLKTLRSFRFWQTIFITTFGLLLFSLGINAISLPHHFLVGGATGIAILIYYLFGFPAVSITYWLLNIPILILGWRIMSLRYIALACIGVMISTFTLAYTHWITFTIPDPFMAAVIAGALTGSGVGLYLKYGGSAGGIDILAAVLRKYYGIPMGTTFISINAFVFIAGGMIHRDLSLAFYTAISMIVHSYMVERFQLGFSGRKAALIVTTEPELISQKIIKKLNRGVTFIQGYGGMSKKPVRIIYTVVNMIELARLKEIIFSCDPRAFIAVNDTAEVIGYRFLTWEDEGFESSKQNEMQH